MVKTIEIKVPDGKKAVWKNGTIVFEDIKSQLPKTWEEFCEMRDSNSQYIEIGELPDGMKRNPHENKNILSSIEAHLALMQLHQLRDCYRQGWVPDWNNENENKYSIISGEVKKYIIQNVLLAPCFLAFQSEEIAEEFLNNFKDLIEQTSDLI